MKTIAALLFLCLAFSSSYAYLPNGSIMGQVTDPVTKKPIGDATVVFDCQGSQKVFFANENGYYYASNIPPCVYTVTVLYLGKTHIYPGVKIIDNDQLTLDMNLAVNADTLPEVTFIGEKGRKPLLDPLDPTINMLDNHDIAVLPVTDIAGLTAMQAGVIAINGDYYVHGARAGGLVFYLDDTRLMGSPDIPISSLDSYRTYTGFLPPKYGDTSGGAVVMETKSYFSGR